MARYAGTGDVVFGVVSSGRGGQLDGIEVMVGLLMNTTAARISVDPGQDGGRVAGGGCRPAQVRARRFEHTALTDIQACADVPAGQPLFDALFVFENYPVPAGGGQGRPGRGGLRVGRRLPRR